VFAGEEEVERGRGDDDLWGVGLAGWSACVFCVGDLWACGLTGVGVELCVVQVFQDVFDGLDRPVPFRPSVPDACLCGTHGLRGHVHLEVASDEELAAHDCGVGENKARDEKCSG
jgi:hypothetical protein